MIFTPHPLRERMTLFWHNHFATSDAKVQNPGLMHRQNALLRSQALGDFQALVSAIGKDPAMLIWLDSTINKKAKPNENYAREVMELFTLGRGHYTEKDIQEAARAFTGWFVVRDQFEEVPRQHDDGVKTVLGQSGHWDGDDIPGILLDQPACAEFICRKLFRHFVSETATPSDCPDRAPGAGVSRIALPDPGARGDDPALEPVLRSGCAAAAGEKSGRVCGGDDPGARDREPDGPVGGPGRGLCPDGPEPVRAAERRGVGRGPGLDQLDRDAGPGQPGPRLALRSKRGTRGGGATPGRWLAGMAAAGGNRWPASSSICWRPDALEPRARQQIEKAATNKSLPDDAAAREVARLILTSPEYQLA